MSGSASSARALADRDAEQAAAPGGGRLDPDEEAVFAAAAAALLPRLEPHPEERCPALAADGEALRALWPQTGAAPPAPTAMPPQPLAPGVLGALWRRLRAALQLSQSE